MKLKHLLLALPLIALVTAPIGALLNQPYRFAGLGAYTQPFEATSLAGIEDSLLLGAHWGIHCYSGICAIPVNNFGL